MKKVLAAILGLSLLIPTQAKANGRDEAIIGGAIALGVLGIIATQAERNRHRDRHHHHYYTPPPPPPSHYHGHSYPPPRLIYRERPYYHPHHHHHWR